MAHDAAGPPPSAEPGHPRLPPVDVVLLQLQGISAWLVETPPQPAQASREESLDLHGAAARRQRERRALLDCLDRQDLAVMRDGGPAQPRVLVVHRQPWFCDRITAALPGLGLGLAGVVHDGADAIGTLVAEQPELVIAEDRLPAVSGRELARRARLLAPRTAVALQVFDEQAVAAALEAGARAVYTRQVPPADLAGELPALLR